MDRIYQQHSQGFQHDYQASFQVLDVDMSGLPCGPKAAFATKGYFAKQRNRRGRQLGRVLASHYGEIVVDRLFDGKTQLTRALQPLILAAEQTLQLEEEKRSRTIVRLDAGGGSLDDVNWLLSRGYLVHRKDSRASGHTPGQERPRLVRRSPSAGAPVRLGDRGARRLRASGQAHRGACRQQDGEFAYGVLISALSAQHVLGLTSQPLCLLDDPAAVLLAYVTFYDQRGGGVETSFPLPLSLPLSLSPPPPFSQCPLCGNDQKKETSRFPVSNFSEVIALQSSSQASHTKACR